VTAAVLKCRLRDFPQQEMESYLQFQQHQGTANQPIGREPPDQITDATKPTDQG
jgi:hypothetical protein